MRPRWRISPAPAWNAAGLGPFEWLPSNRAWLRAVFGEDGFPSFYTPKPRPVVPAAVARLRARLAGDTDNRIPF